jgi:hypothetical protein
LAFAPYGGEEQSVARCRGQGEAFLRSPSLSPIHLFSYELIRGGSVCGDRSRGDRERDRSIGAAMTWCNSFNDVRAVENSLATAAAVAAAKKQQQASSHVNLIRTCPSCGHRAQYEQVDDPSRQGDQVSFFAWACTRALVIFNYSVYHFQINFLFI